MRIWIGVAAVALAVGCGKKKDDGAKDEAVHESKTPAPSEATSLWDLAPAGAIGGVVLNPGSLEKLYAGMDEVRRVAAADPLLAPVIEQLLKKPGAPFDIWSLEAARRDGGVDPSRGFAVFFDADSEVLLVAAPVADMAGFEKFTGKTAAERDGRRVLGEDNLVCAEASGRVLCARSVEAIDAAGDGAAKLTDRVPARARGDVEIIVDLARLPSAVAKLSKAIRNPGKLAVGIKLDAGVIAVDAHVVGQIALPGAAAKAPTLPIDELAESAVGLVRVHWEAQTALKLAPLPPAVSLTPSFDARTGFLDQLTGEAVVTTMSGRDVGGFRAEVGLTDPVPLRDALPELCGLAAKQLPQARVDVQKGFCAVELEVPPVPELPPGLTPVGKVRSVIEVTGGGLRVTVGDPSSPGRVPPVSPHTAKYQNEPAMLAGWGRSFDPLAALDDDAFAALQKVIATNTDTRERAVIRTARWIAAHIAEVGFSVRVEGDGVGMSLTLVTFAADPKDVYAAYEAAVQKDLAGDRVGYRAAMKALAGNDKTLAGAQALVVERGGPALGFGSGVLAAIAIPAFVKYKQKSETADAFSEIKRIYDSVEP